MNNIEIGVILLCIGFVIEAILLLILTMKVIDLEIKLEREEL